jgi:hypothetical protein
MTTRILFLGLLALSLTACDPIKDETGGPVDADGDGYGTDEDCDDDDPAVNPGADEACNGADDDCDGEVDEEVDLTWYADADGDGHGDAAQTTTGCEPGEGWVEAGDDCDDTDDAVSPSATEICDPTEPAIDNDCDGLLDDEDDSLDSSTGETWFRDADGDGYGDADETTLACIPPDGYTDDSSDCDDTDDAVNPAAQEICNGYDDDCDDLSDGQDDSVDNSTGSTWYLDSDGDGYGDPRTTTTSCNVPSGWVGPDFASDCDDTDAAVNPDATEVCDEIDNDCNGDSDDADSDVDLSTGSTWYLDGDGDGYGDADTSVVSCAPPKGYSADATDCDDDNTSVSPAATEVCDEIDNDCDGLLDDDDDDVDLSSASAWYMDADGDGWADSRVSTWACDAASGWLDGSLAADCDDDEAAVNPDATEICDEIDNDCDGLVDDDDSSLDASSGSTWYADGDGDGYGDPASGAAACEQPSGHVDAAAATDCDDSDAGINPGAAEVCSGVDDDCDGLVDDDDSSLDSSTWSTWYEDADADGYGNPSMSMDRCDAPTGFVADASDCLDVDATVHPSAAEACDGLDNDCDGVVDGGLLGDGEDCAATDCVEVLADQPGATDGAYWIDPASSGAYEVLCDMGTDGGGWVLTATGSDDSQNTWTWDARAQWDSDTTPIGDIDHPEEDFKSPAHHEVAFEDLLFVHQPSGIWAEYDAVGDGSGTFANFLGGLSDAICYTGDDGWAMTAGTLTVTGDLCSTDLFFNAMDMDGVSCSSHDDADGPAWSASNNVGCPLDDAGHYGFGNNRLYPSTESNASTATYFGAGFGGAIGENTGTLGAAENYIQVWVR